MIGYHRILASALLVCAPLVIVATAQPLGTFRWQLQPFCNVATVAVTQNGAVYRLEGTDDQCGNGADAASVTGTAFPNPDGTIGFGLNIVTTPGGRPLHVDAEITTATFSGTWRDSTGATGTFAFRPGAGSGGSPRPLPTAAVPSAIQLLGDGGVVASGTGSQGAIPASGAGARMMWYPGKLAFRAGAVFTDEWDDANVGIGSNALGVATRASGSNSTALGLLTTASGSLSTAMGSRTVASGVNSTAMGSRTTAGGVNAVAMGQVSTASGAASAAMNQETTASGTASTAMGFSTTASGNISTAMGASTTASGLRSTAMGNGNTASGENALAGGNASVAAGASALAFGAAVRANGNGSVALGTNAFAAQNGSFVFADRSVFTEFAAPGPNEFHVRAAGGVKFASNAAATLGVELAPNGSQFTSLSDVRTKHRFRELDHDDVLAKIAQMPVTEWSYKAQDAAHSPHRPHRPGLPRRLRPR